MLPNENARQHLLRRETFSGAKLRFIDCGSA